MQSANRSYLALFEIEPRIVPDATPTVLLPVDDIPAITTDTPPAVAPDVAAITDNVAYPPEFIDWLDAQAIAADSVLTLHGVDVGSSVTDLLYREDPNAPPPTATTLEYVEGRDNTGPLVTLAADPPPPNPKTPPTGTPKPPARPPVVPAPMTGNDKNGNPYLPSDPKATPPIPQVVPYKDPKPGSPYQAGHLYQQAPFNSWIHSNRSATIPMCGNTTTSSSQQYTFHYYIDEFWSQY